MSKVIGFHIVCTTYGFWLPNDERGSGSDFVRSETLTKFGPASYVVDRKRSRARKPFDFELRRLARESLLYPPVTFTLEQINAVSRGIENELAAYAPAPVYALGSLRDHFHIVTGPCRYDIRRFAGRLKGAATKQLRKEGIHPLQKYERPDGTIPSPWSQNPWVAYEFKDEGMRRAIKYVNDNLKRAGLFPQNHSFVIPYPPR